VTLPLVADLLFAEVPVSIGFIDEVEDTQVEVEIELVLITFTIFEVFWLV
jgi:hypothetical protein